MKRRLLLLGLPIVAGVVWLGRRLRRSGGAGGEASDVATEPDLPPIEWDGTLPQDLLEILACPKCKSSLTYEQEHRRLVCATCQVYYPVRDGIPILLIEEAQPLAGAAAGGAEPAGTET